PPPLLPDAFFVAIVSLPLDSFFWFARLCDTEVPASNAIRATIPKLADEKSFLFRLTCACSARRGRLAGAFHGLRHRCEERAQQARTGRFAVAELRIQRPNEVVFRLGRGLRSDASLSAGRLLRHAARNRRRQRRLALSPRTEDVRT